MPERTLAIAPIPLARSRLRLLILPVVLVAIAGGAAAGGLTLGGIGEIVLFAVAALVAALALVLALVLLTVRLDVEVATLRLRWLGGERRYMLARGAVTRVAMRGRGAARLRARFGAFGWALGPARLRDDERVEVVRLAPAATAILVPTDRGRIALVPRSEAQLIEALTAAARVQQRLDEVASRAKLVIPEPAPEVEEPQPTAVGPEAEPEAAGQRFLTGIERTLLEERLAAQRAAALAAAEAERRAAAEAVSATAQRAALPDQAAGERRWPRLSGRQRDGSGVAPAGEAAAREPMVRAGRLLRLAGRTASASVPLLVASGIAIAAVVTRRLELPTPELRTAVLALALAGPLGSLGALMARAWFPRLAWLVGATSLLVLGLVARALLV